MSKTYLQVIFVVLVMAGVARAEEPAKPPVTVVLTDAKFPANPGYFVLGARATMGERHMRLRVGLFLPPAYFKSKEPFPMVVTLHNRGWNDGDSGITGEGLASLWLRDDDERSAATQPADKRIVVRKDAQFVGIAPQDPPGQEFETYPMPQIIVGVMDAVAAKYRIDQDREYLTGFSYGGSCTWRVAEQFPQKFAAIAPISARQPADPKATIHRLLGVPTYLTSGTNEWATPTVKMMADQLKAQEHPDYVYRIIEGGNHWCYVNVYEDPEFWKWMFARKRSASTTQPATQPVEHPQLSSTQPAHDPKRLTP